MQALLLRIGIDKGCGGCLAPIFKDGSFEYIPIPEGCASSEDKTYSKLSGKNYKSIVKFIPKKLCDAIPHIDPEFKTFTYGDPTPNKRKQLARLLPGDLLIFYAGLEPENDISRIFIVGYFTIKDTYDFSKIPKSAQSSMLQKLYNNAHAKRKYLDERLVIVKGDPQKSRLLLKVANK